MQSVPLAIGLSGKELQGVPIMVQQSLAEKNRHAQMMEVTRQNLSKLGTGPNQGFLLNFSKKFLTFFKIQLKVTNLPEEVTEDNRLLISLTQIARDKLKTRPSVVSKL